MKKKCGCTKKKVSATDFGMEIKGVMCIKHFVEKHGKENLPVSLQTNTK